MRKTVVKIVISSGSEWQKQCVEELINATLMVTKNHFEGKHKANKFEYSISDEYKTGDFNKNKK
jgi:hypothetical protein